jgi:hypothetical protein
MVPSERTTAAARGFGDGDSNHTQDIYNAVKCQHSLFDFPRDEKVGGEYANISGEYEYLTSGIIAAALDSQDAEQFLAVARQSAPGHEARSVQPAGTVRVLELSPIDGLREADEHFPFFPPAIDR